MKFGATDTTKIKLEFSEEDLSDFRVPSNIRHQVNSPVIAYATNPAGTFRYLGVESIINTDSLTFGTILSELTIQPTIGQKLYLAIGLAPQVPSEGLYFIPEPFSPQSNDGIFVQ